MRDRILLLLFYRSERRKRGLEIEVFFFFFGVLGRERSSNKFMALGGSRKERPEKKRNERERERGKLIIGDVNFYI